MRPKPCPATGKALLALVALLYASAIPAVESTCYGTTSNGRIENGVQLPPEGPNFVSYSSTAEILGRTWVHSEVRDIVLDAYRSLEPSAPDRDVTIDLLYRVGEQANDEQLATLSDTAAAWSGDFEQLACAEETRGADFTAGHRPTRNTPL